MRGIASLLLSLTLLLGMLFSAVPAAAATTAGDYPYKVMQLVNAERAEAGLAEVVWDDGLAACAAIRAKELTRKFSHERPEPPKDSTKKWPKNVNNDGVYNPASVADEAGVPYTWIMENVGYGQKTPEQIVQSWMKSAGHRSNILSESHTRCGVGYYEPGNYWALWLDSDPPAETKKFSLTALQEGIQAMSAELDGKKLYDSRITSIGKQLVRLNKEISANRVSADAGEVRAALKDLDALLTKADMNKLSVYAKPAAAKKSDKAALDVTRKKLDALRKQLDKAMKA